MKTLNKIKQFLSLRRQLDMRMVEIDETMNLQKATDVYGECVCKMNRWPVEVRGGYSMQFAEIGFSFMNGYIKALRDNGFCFKSGLVKPIDPERDIPCGALGHYDEKIRTEYNRRAVEVLRNVMQQYESSKANIATIVSAFEEQLKS